MNPFLAMLLSLRIGFVPSPAASAALSIREESLQAATDVAARDTFVQRQSVRAPQSLLSIGLSRSVESSTAQANPWGPPPKFHIRSEDWRRVIEKTLDGNQTLANAAMWLASAPLRLTVSPQKVFVGISLRTP